MNMIYQENVFNLLKTVKTQVKLKCMSYQEN